jgi:hypothetical protein
VGISYYRTDRVPNENTVPAAAFYPCPVFDPAICRYSDAAPPCQVGVGTKNSDYALAGGSSLNTRFDFKVVSPVFPPPDGTQAGFNGDYSGLIINKGLEARPHLVGYAQRQPVPVEWVRP